MGLGVCRPEIEAWSLYLTCCYTDLYKKTTSLHCDTILMDEMLHDHTCLNPEKEVPYTETLDSMVA